jgi:Ser/Thr protein kinase RdoA (MazF antagonist)
VRESMLLGVIRDEYGLPAQDLTPGGRGALGEVWRSRVDGAPDLAVKLLRHEPEESRAAKEAAHLRVMAAKGLLVPLAVLNRHERYVTTVTGGWVRVSEWIDGVKPPPADPLTPARLGAVLGRMHANAAAVPDEPPGQWYSRPPDAARLAELVAIAERPGSHWAGRLEEFLPTLQGLSVITKAPAQLAVCHRDLHPDNVLLTPDGRLALLDWDNFGPADLSQELASVVLYWFADREGIDGPLARSFVEAYHCAGGTGRLTAIDDFAMHIATTLNFLVLQLEAFIDPETGPEARHRVVAEIEESMRFVPGTAVLEQALERLRPASI